MRTFALQPKPSASPAPQQTKPIFGSSRQSLLSPNARTLADLSTPLVQTKLTVNEPGDNYEQEADRVADEVMRSNVGPSRVSLPAERQTVGGYKGNVLSKTTVAAIPGLGHDCEPENPNEVSLRLVDTNTCLNISHSIVGTIQVIQNEVETDPISISNSDSILDATSDHEGALSAGECKLAHAVAKIVRSTVIGHVHVHAIKLAENNIFTSLVVVARRPIGCIRFSYVPPFVEHPQTKTQIYSRTPRRFNSQPDLVERKAVTPEKAALEARRVRPQFNGVRYGATNYLQLTHATAAEIKRGDDDESEMGVYHDLFQSQREANLRARLDEYTPAGMDGGIIFEN